MELASLPPSSFLHFLLLRVVSLTLPSPSCPFPVSLRLWRQPWSNPATTHPFLGVQPCATLVGNAISQICFVLMARRAAESRENRRRNRVVLRYLNPLVWIISISHCIEWIYEKCLCLLVTRLELLAVLKEERNKMNIVGDVLYRRNDFWIWWKMVRFYFYSFFFLMREMENWFHI